MRQPVKLFLALVLAAGFAAGCGSDDDSSSGGGGSAGSDKATTSAPAAKPKKASARAELVTCIEDGGFEVTHEGDDDATATNYTIEAGGSKKAEIIIHSNKNDAAVSSRKAGEDKGINAIPFGRTEFRRGDAATDTEAGVLANCVSGAYVR